MSTRIQNDTSITVIIPTTCERSRAAQLNRALDSVFVQNVASLQCIVVVNGSRVDPDTVEKLKNDERIRVIEQKIGSLPIALQNGRANVTSEFFAFLDDDDELLKDSLKMRLNAILQDENLAAVISNGFISLNGNKKEFYDIKNISADPLVSLMSSNWLTSCGALYRTCFVPSDYFSVKYYEWTYVAFRLALEHKIKFIEHRGFIVYQDTPGSLSKTNEYSDRYPLFIKQLLAHSVPENIRRILKIKLGMAFHCNAERLREENKMLKAWRNHWASLLCVDGWKYLLYTRKLVVSSVLKSSGR